MIAADDRTVHFLADWDHIDHFVCGSPNERLVVTQDASKVVLTVQGFAEPLPAGVACGGVGSPLQPFVVVLKQRLRGRELIDGQGQQSRDVLQDSSVPTAHAVPAGYIEQPLTWSSGSSDEHTAVRIWRQGALYSDHFVRLTVGLPTTFYTFAGPAGTSHGTIPVNGSTAHVYESETRNQVSMTVRWTAPSGQQRSLEAFGTTRDHLTASDVVTIARSVH